MSFTEEVLQILTFDPAALKRDLKRIRCAFEEELITVPGFDHGRGDPEPDQHAFFDRNHHKVVIICDLFFLSFFFIFSKYSSTSTSFTTRTARKRLRLRPCSST